MKREQKRGFLIGIGVLFILQCVDNIFLKIGSYQLNEGTFFGLFGDNFIALVLSFLALMFFLILVRILKFNYFDLLVTLIISASLSNIISRIIHGGTIDYLRLLGIPVFNFSDIVIVVAFIHFVFNLFFANKKSLV